jgi:hypothetical protein
MSNMLIIRNNTKQYNLTLCDNNKLYYDIIKANNVDYILNDDVLIITCQNNIKHFYIKNNDNIFDFYLFDNFDLEYYKSQVNDVKINGWI